MKETKEEFIQRIKEFPGEDARQGWEDSPRELEFVQDSWRILREHWLGKDMGTSEAMLATAATFDYIMTWAIAGMDRGQSMSEVLYQLINVCLYIIGEIGKEYAN